MAAGISERVWEISDIVKLMNERPEKSNLDDAQYGPALGFEPRGYRH
jgi:hypothetical protein